MNVALILAGGSGSRTGLDVPKQFAPIRNKPLIAWTVSCFESHTSIDRIIIVSKKENIPDIENIITENSFSKISGIIPGGNTRQESSYNGVIGAHCLDDDIICIHDAARPFVRNTIIDSCIESARSTGASLPVIKPVDTILSSDAGGFLDSYMNREILACAQTPQCFRYSVIRQAHELALEDGFNEATDDTMLVKRIGVRCALVTGDPDNMKITTARDLLLAEYIAGYFPRA